MKENSILPMNVVTLLHFCISLSLILKISTAIDNISPTNPIRDSGETIVSASGTFVLGFFSPGTSKKRYLGIWHGNIPARGRIAVWVANKDNPLNDSSGVLKITNRGILVLHNQNGSTIWSSNSSKSAWNPIAQLSDTGNFIVKGKGDNNPENFLWQSFDYPGDTLLPEMKIGRNVKTGMEWYLSSWKTPDDPSPGHFTNRLELGGYPEFFVIRDSVKQFRLGPWNGIRFSGTPQLSPTPLFTYEFVLNEEEIYWSFQNLNTSIPLKMVLNYDDGSLLGYEWIERTQSWVPVRSTHIDDCDYYALCGAYSSCTLNNGTLCGCLKGFAPKTSKDPTVVGWSNGCVRDTKLNCSGDGFQKYTGLKLPETRKSWFNNSMNLDECKSLCMKNCSCTAYTNLDIGEGGSGCLLWFDDLIDLRQLIDNGQDIYIRMASSEIDREEKINKLKKIILMSVLPAGMLLLSIALLLYVWKKKQQKGSSFAGCSSQQNDLDLPLFDLGTIASATNNFSVTNKLGEGGFGPVYKGSLNDGQEVAVKRLSKNSTQGLDEFKNEVMHIAKLQHRNLVRLLGCCIQGDEKLLIYEFMPNKSLDFFIFDPAQSTILNWPTRYHIINGIARGLLYLHHDSRLRIIHRDLKASNVLLDFEMNPKISDFGLARSFGGNEIEAKTNKVVGTYGYMSPEYIINGHYSLKSDVFSFGVMVLEIVSGKRNREFSDREHHLNLLGHAWKLYQESRSVDLTASAVRDSCNLSEVLRSVHVGLLCVQRNPEDRPNMTSVVLMLGGEGGLPQPKQPGFFTDKDIIEAISSSRNLGPSSANNLTISLLEAR